MATEITKAVQWLKSNLPALEVLAAEAEKLGALRDDARAISAEIRSLDATRTQMRADIEAQNRSIEAASLKATAAREAQVKVSLTRLEDIQRQQKTHEDQVIALRAKIEEQAKLHAVREAEHLASLRDIEQRGVKAAAELLKTQEKIKALHAHLTGAPA